MTSEAAGVAATLVWLDMVVAISFLEAPLKFRHLAWPSPSVWASAGSSSGHSTSPGCSPVDDKGKAYTMQSTHLATLQVLRGQAQLITATRQWTGRAGDHVIIARERHELLVVEDTAVLLTVVSAP